jgi:hypothetical protein
LASLRLFLATSRLSILLTSLLNRSLEIPLTLRPRVRFVVLRSAPFFSSPSGTKFCLPLQFLFLPDPIRYSGLSRRALLFFCLLCRSR